MVTVSDFNRGIAGGNTGARSSNSSNNDPSGGRRQAYEDMASVGIRGVSGRTTDDSDGKGSFDRGEKAREIQLDYLADRDRAFYTPYEDQLLDFGRFSDVPSEGLLTETAGDPIRQKIVSNILRGKPPRDKVPLIDQFNNFMTSFGQNKINIPFPSIATFGAAALEGMDSTNKFFKNLNTKIW